MKKRALTEKEIFSFEKQLHLDEKSPLTISKYLHDIRCFMRYLAGNPVSKELALSYKEYLKGKYTISSANSMIAALNSLFRYLGWTDCCLKQFKTQRKIYCSDQAELTKAEYTRLVAAAKNSGNDRLYLILLTLCGTGIRVSELAYITVEAVNRGEAVVSGKNKTRSVFIVRELQKKLNAYIKKHKLSSGSVFVTRHNRPVSRCNVWRAMKMLCRLAQVPPEKVFPHNLRHLFARTFYSLEKDIAKLADVLGHFSINTTRLYIISTGTEHRRKMEYLHLII